MRIEYHNSAVSTIKRQLTEDENKKDGQLQLPVGGKKKLYGYKIVDGRAVVDRAAQKKIQLLFQNYLAGMSLSKAAEEAGIDIPHGMVGKLLSNQHYACAAEVWTEY